jgi:serine carboxypeptidase-like clade 2
MNMHHSLGPLRIAAVVGSCLTAFSAPAADRITSLPGLSPLPSYPMYSGYVNVDAAADRNLFYWLVTAATDSPSTPLVLWLTGGPGCSSLFALTSEHGFAFPSVQDPTQLELNPYSWNQVGSATTNSITHGASFMCVVHCAGC